MKSIAVHPHLTHDEIVARFDACDDAKLKVRWNLLRLMTRPVDPRRLRQAAADAGLGERTARNVLNRWNADGPDGLSDRRSSNSRPCPLSSEQIQTLAAAIDGCAPDGGLWTGRKVATFAREKFGVQVGPRAGWVWLTRLGFTLQIPRPAHPQAATDDERRRWRRRPDEQGRSLEGQRSRQGRRSAVAG